MRLDVGITCWMLIKPVNYWEFKQIDKQGQQKATTEFAKI